MHNMSQSITVKAALILVIILPCSIVGILHAQDRPVANFSYEGNCAGAPVRFSDQTKIESGEALSWWWWDFGDQRPGEFNYAYKPNPEHTYMNPGIYEVRLIVGDISGRRDTVTNRVEIIPRPETPLIKDSILCFNDISDLFAQSRDANKLVWYKDMESLTPINMDDTALVHIQPLSDTLFVETLSPQSCRSERVPAPVALFSDVLAEIVVDADKLSLPEAKVNFSVSTPYLIADWLWDFGDSDTAHQPEPAHVYTIPGVYEVSVELTNDEGCKLRLEKEILIKNPSMIQFPSAFSPNGDGFNDTFEIEAEDLADFLVQIFDQEGKLVFESTDKYFVWDGWGMDGNLQREGVYECVVTGKDLAGNEVEERHQFTLIK